MRKKLLSLLLTLTLPAALLLSGGAALTARADEAEGSAPEAAAEEDSEQAAEEAAGPEADPVDTVILYTGDVHCGIDEGFGYAGLEQIRDYLTEAGNDVILADAGDNIQGGSIGIFTKGQALLDLMNDMAYDIAIPGNHEFDYGGDRFLELAEEASFPYVSCNVSRSGELCFDPYRILESGGKKIAFVGATTPTTITESSAQHFWDENGETIYDFLQNDGGQPLYDAVQAAVDDARAEGADYVILLAHLGNQESCRPWTYADVIANTAGIDAVLDGHSHDTDQVTMKNKDGQEVPRSASGTRMECVGWCRIAVDGTVTTGLYTWNNDVPAPVLLGIDNGMAAAVQNARAELAETMNQVAAHTDVTLTINDPEAVDGSGNPIRMVRRAETNLGDLCADAWRVRTGADVSIINGGAVRTSIHAGDITNNDLLNVMPFTNALCTAEVTGQQILDALEWGARSVPAEEGGFLQVSGITYEIHTCIDSPCVSSDGVNFGSIEGERRVKNVMIGGEPADPDKVYTLASSDYILEYLGNGYAMFADADVNETGLLDSQAFTDYIVEDLGGTVGPEYEELTGDGRIVIVEEEP